MGLPYRQSRSACERRWRYRDRDSGPGSNGDQQSCLRPDPAGAFSGHGRTWIGPARHGDGEGDRADGRWISRSSIRKIATQRPTFIDRISHEKGCRGLWKKLAKRSIKDTKPDIPRGQCFWDLSRAEESAVKKLISSDEVIQLATLLRSRENGSEVTLVDAAYWRKGCSSPGLFRSAILLQIDGGDDHSFCLLDVKQAVKPAAPRRKGAKMPRNNAARVVEGASKLSPFLGGRMIACSLLGRDVFVRELLPQDLKLDIENLKPQEAVHVGRYLAAVLGRAHGRQMDASTRRSWRTELGRARSKSLDAPSWLWASALSLMAHHETAYLEHCRQYAESL